MWPISSAANLELAIGPDVVSRHRFIGAASGRKTSAPSPACGSAETEFRSGESDLRGLFIAGNVHGKATVIACEGESRY